MESAAQEDHVIFVTRFLIFNTKCRRHIVRFRFTFHRHAQCTDSPVLMVTALILNGSVTVTMIAVTSQMRAIVVPSLALRGKQNAAIPMRASTPRGFVMVILTVKMDGMKAKLFVTKPVVLVAFVARQGIVSLCSGVVMVSMIVVMAVMKCSAKSITSHVPVDSLLVGTVSLHCTSTLAILSL